jgi:hypothetical protein
MPGAQGPPGVVSASAPLSFNSGTGALSIDLSAYQPLDGDLTALAAVTGTNTIYYRNGANSWAAVNVSTGLSFSGGNLTATSGAAQPGTLVELTRQTVSGAVASVDFTSGIDATYDEYELHFYNVFPSVEQGLSFQISQDGGATWQSDASYQYGWYVVGSVGSPANAQTSEASNIALGTQGISGSVYAQMSGVIRFWRPFASGEMHTFIIDTISHDSIRSFNSVKGTGGYAGTNAFNGIRFFWPAGANFAKGTFILYGIKK